MTKRLALFASACVALVLVLMACAPTAAPGAAPGPAPVAAPQSRQLGANPAAAVSPQEAAWQRTVEAARKEGRVTLYSYGFIGDIGLALQRAFKEKYGVSVDIISGRGAEFIERLKTEQRVGSIMADFMEGSHLHMTNAKVSGLTIEAASGTPSLGEKDVWVIHPLDFYDKEGHVLAYNYYLYSPWVNTNLVKPQDYPRTWKELLQPRWKGKMMISTPRVSGNVYTNFVPLINRKILGWDYVEALGKQDLRLSTGLTQEGEWLARGERELSIFGTVTTWGSFVDQGAPIRAIPMEEGVVAGGTAAVLIKGSPHPNAGRLFLNWLFSPEGQLVHAKARSVGSIRKDVKDYSPEPGQITAKKIVVPTDEDANHQAQLFREGSVTKMWQLK